MGMYATFGESQVKFSGIIARLAVQCGVSCEDGYAIVTRENVKYIVSTAWVEFSNGEALKHSVWAECSTHVSISGQHLYSFASDVQDIALLFDWLTTTEEERIIFS